MSEKLTPEESARYYLDVAPYYEGCAVTSRDFLRRINSGEIKLGISAFDPRTGRTETLGAKNAKPKSKRRTS